MEFSRPEYWSGQPFPSPGDLPNPGNEPRSPALRTDSLPTEPQGKPKNTGVGSLSLLQQIFLTQELNQDLLHCRYILYQLNHQGSPVFPPELFNFHCSQPKHSQGKGFSQTPCPIPVPAFLLVLGQHYKRTQGNFGG